VGKTGVIKDLKSSKLFGILVSYPRHVTLGDVVVADISVVASVSVMAFCA
jgi:hypothetical protein